MIRFVYLAGLLVLLGACAEEPPPPRTAKVVVAEVVQGPYQPKSRYVGRLQAQEDVAIQARVTGYVQSREFHEGDRVEAGAVLYTIDASEYAAKLARARNGRRPPPIRPTPSATTSAPSNCWPKARSPRRRWTT